MGAIRVGDQGALHSGNWLIVFIDSFERLDIFLIPVIVVIHSRCTIIISNLVAILAHRCRFFVAQEQAFLILFILLIDMFEVIVALDLLDHILFIFFILRLLQLLGELGKGADRLGDLAGENEYNDCDYGEKERQANDYTDKRPVLGIFDLEGQILLEAVYDTLFNKDHDGKIHLVIT